MTLSPNQNNKMELSSENQVFFEMLEVPIYCNLLWSDQQAAKDCPKGDLKLAFCPQTGLIYNVAFDSSKLGYSQDYENSLHYSPRFQEYADRLAQGLIKDYDLHQKDIIEIGCGKGDFLISLCSLGENKGIGFDPTYVPREEHQAFTEQVKFVQDFYSEDYKDYQADLICCRHTLEHVLDPSDLLKPLRKAIGDRLNTAVFFEVPNALYTFQELAVWDIIYEHCCYFTPTSLAYAFIDHGFEVKNKRTEFEEQFLCLEAVPVAENVSFPEQHQQEIESLSQDLATFSSKFATLVQTWTEKLRQINQAGQKIVLWGAGSKGVTFLNILKCGDLVEYIVDLNPRKQGMYVPGTGQKIVPPEFLQDYHPDLVIVMNPIYEEEIRQMILDMGLTNTSITTVENP